MLSKQPLPGTEGAVACSLATQVGFTILNQGYNALDAAIIVTYPAMCTKRGGMLLFIWEIQNRKLHNPIF